MKPLEMIEDFRKQLESELVDSRWQVAEFLQELKSSLLAVIAAQKAAKIEHKPEPWVSSTATLISALNALASSSEDDPASDGTVACCLHEAASRLFNQHAMNETLKARIELLESRASAVVNTVWVPLVQITDHDRELANSVKALKEALKDRL